jgi:hypothetical protein
MAVADIVRACPHHFVGHGTDETFLIEISGSAKATAKRNVEGTASMAFSLRVEDTVGG